MDWREKAWDFNGLNAVVPESSVWEMSDFGRD